MGIVGGRSVSIKRDLAKLSIDVRLWCAIMVVSRGCESCFQMWGCGHLFPFDMRRLHDLGVVHNIGMRFVDAFQVASTIGSQFAVETAETHQHMYVSIEFRL